MALSLENYRQEIDNIIDENKRLKSDLEQKDKLLDELRNDMRVIKEQTKAFEPYMDIIEREEKESYILNIKNSWLFKQLKIRARQVFGPDGDKGYLFCTFLEDVLTDAVGVGWLTLRSRRFGKRNENT